MSSSASSRTTREISPLGTPPSSRAVTTRSASPRSRNTPAIKSGTSFLLPPALVAPRALVAGAGGNHITISARGRCGVCPPPAVAIVSDSPRLRDHRRLSPPHVKRSFRSALERVEPAPTAPLLAACEKKHLAPSGLHDRLSAVLGSAHKVVRRRLDPQHSEVNRELRSKKSVASLLSPLSAPTPTSLSPSPPIAPTRRRSWSCTGRSRSVVSASTW